MSNPETPSKRKETRGAIRLPLAIEERFKAARDKHGTSTPRLMLSFLEFFESLTLNQQAALIRGEFRVEPD